MDILEAAYSPELAGAAWTERIVHLLMSLTGSRSAAFFRINTTYGESGDFMIDGVSDAKWLGHAQWTANTLHTITHAPASESMFGQTQGITLSEASGLGPMIPSIPGWRDCWRGPVVDSLGLISRDARGDGTCVCVGLTKTLTATTREKRLLTKLATHIGSGNRLQLHPRSSPVDDADAILSPNGKVLFAGPTAEKKRDQIDEGRRRRSVARKSRHDAEKGLEVWQGLIAGTWSLVDFVDTDKKRLVLVMKNSPQVDPRADLTPRERRVTALAAMGHRDKEIAYMLGLMPTAVARSLRSSRQKLGAASRVDLAAKWRRKLPIARSNDERSGDNLP